MTEVAAPIQHLTAGGVDTWYQHGNVEMVVGDALDPSGDMPVVIGFARYREGVANEVTLPYDEALIIARGTFTVRRADGTATARAGEVIFPRAGAEVVYQADEDAEMVYVCQPALPMGLAGGPAQGFHPAGDALAAKLAPDTPPTEPSER
jgi:ethanolamine utilization protein EutQ